MNDPEIHYRPVSSAAVASAVSAVLTLLAFVFPSLVSLAFIGIGVGALALTRIHENGYRGAPLAFFGLSACLLIALAAPGWHYYLYTSEAPPGVVRLDFAELVRSDSEYFARHEGQNVCLKGYAYPGQREVVSEFVLLAEGDTGKLNTMALVTLRAGQTWKINSRRAIAVSGTLVANPAAGSEYQPKYLLKNCTVRPSRTTFDLVEWRSTGC